MRRERPRPISRTLDAHMIQDTASYKRKSADTCNDKGAAWARRYLKMKRHSRSLQRCPDLLPLSSLWGIAAKRRVCFKLKDKLVNPADSAENSSSSSCFLLSPEEDVVISSQVFTAKSIISPWQETGNRVSERRNRWSLWELITCQRLNANTVNWVTNTSENDWDWARPLAWFVFY